MNTSKIKFKVYVCSWTIKWSKRTACHMGWKISPRIKIVKRHLTLYSKDFLQENMILAKRGHHWRFNTSIINSLNWVGEKWKIHDFGWIFKRYSIFGAPWMKIELWRARRWQKRKFLAKIIFSISIYKKFRVSNLKSLTHFSAKLSHKTGQNPSLSS